MLAAQRQLNGSFDMFHACSWPAASWGSPCCRVSLAQGESTNEIVHPCAGGQLQQPARPHNFLSHLQLPPTLTTSHQLPRRQSSLIELFKLFKCTIVFFMDLPAHYRFIANCTDWKNRNPSRLLACFTRTTSIIRVITTACTPQDIGEIQGNKLKEYIQQITT